MTPAFRWSHARAALGATRAAAACITFAALGLALPAQAAMLISQVYGGGGNGGATLQHDFIEIYNNGTVSENIGGWSVQYASASGASWQITAIPAGTVVPPGRYLLIRQAAGAGGTVPVVGDVTGGIAMAAASGKVALANTSTAFTVAAPVGPSLVDVVSYGSATPTEGTPTGVLSATTAALRNNAGCTDTNNNSADFTIAAPAPRNSSAPTGTCSGGGGGGGGGAPVTATIPAIQGAGAVSPLVGQAVITNGVVTKVLNNGFFMQDQAGDGNPATSDGIFVFTSSAPPAAAQVGSLVQVTGSVVEFAPGAGTAATPLTEISSVVSVQSLGTGNTILPVAVTLPLPAGETLERYEGMLVSINGTLTVQQNFFQARYGQLTLGLGRHETPTNRHRPGAAAQALADLQARSRLLLDDSSSFQNPNPTPYFGANGLPRAGDTVSNLVGVIDFGLATNTASGAGLYRLQPTAAPEFSTGNPRPAAPVAATGNLKLGSMNVLNFFTTFTNGDTADGLTGQTCTLGGQPDSASNCRGANNLVEFQRQRSKIVRALAGLNADAVGLMEIQNNGNFAAQNLVDALNASVGSGTYAVVPAPAAGTGTDAIRLAMIYKPAKLSLVNSAASDTDPVNNRPPLAQTFAAANGERFTLVVNHLKSKGSCPSAGDADAPGNLDTGDGQGCWNALRLAQAQRLRTFVAQQQAASGSNDVLLVGDMNAYGQEDPIFELTSNGYVDQALRYTPFAYSYVFDGAAGRLDHAISTPTMSPRITSVSHWHINADEQLSYDYNQEFKAPLTTCGGLCPADPSNPSDPFRSSDHDPVLVGLSLYKAVNGTAGRDILVGSPGDDILYGGFGGDTLTGGNGQNIYRYTALRDAGDTITDFVPGKDLLDLATLLASLGYSGSNPVGDGWLRFVALARNATSVEIDIDGPGPAASRSLVTLLGVNASTLLPRRDIKLATQSRSALRR